MRTYRARRFVAPVIALFCLLAGVTSGAAATLPPTIMKAFGASSIPLNATTSLTFTISNPNAASTLTGIAFTDKGWRSRRDTMQGAVFGWVRLSRRWRLILRAD